MEHEEWLARAEVFAVSALEGEELAQVHLDSHTDEGALMLVISSTQNELLV